MRAVATADLAPGLQARVPLHPATASRLAITPQMIVDALYNAFGQRQISTVFTQLNQYRVVLEVLPEFRMDPSVLDRVYLRSSAGGQVPLSTLATIEQRATALAVSHQRQFPAVTVSFNVAPSVALDAQRSQGRPAREAIEQASLLRFRPIIMTTMAALLGGVPLAFGHGVGSELREPLGVAIVGGLIVSQVLTLYTTPVIYLAFDRLAERLARRRAPTRSRAGQAVTTP